MKTRFLLSLLVLSGAAHAQTAPTTPESAPFFRDVPRNHWAFAAVQRLAGAGVLEGYPTTGARPAVAGSTAPKTVVAAKPVAPTAQFTRVAPKVARVAVAKTSTATARNR